MKSYIFFANSDVIRTIKSVVTAMRFTIDDKRLINWV